MNKKRFPQHFFVRAFLGTEFSSWNGIPRDRDIPRFPGQGKEGHLKHGAVQDGIEPSLNWTGLRFHWITRDGIGISRDFTGRDFMWNEKNTVHGTGLIYHGILRDEKSTELFGSGFFFSARCVPGLFVFLGLGFG